MAHIHDEKCLNSLRAWTGLDKEYDKQYCKEHEVHKKECNKNIMLKTEMQFQNIIKVSERK